MAIKQDIEAIKKEIGAEEQFLESIIKGERFFKKYRYPMIGLASLVVVVAIGYGVVKSINKNRLLESNEAYQTLLKDSNNINALSVLKETNEPLYEAYLFQKATLSKNPTELKAVLNSSADPLLKDIASFVSGDDNSKIMEDVILLLNGYEYLKNGKTKEAKNVFAQIPLTSSLQELVKKLNHYQGK